ncbi:MAG TPA: hypothetical protein VNM22_21595 [Candidatus Limnocylindrales bacterium]|nr:hypothetical protein [Candidatus Limnocylindrales bacterium]
MKKGLSKRNERREQSPRTSLSVLSQHPDSGILLPSLDYPEAAGKIPSVSYDRYKLKRISHKNPKAKRYFLFLIA